MVQAAGKAELITVGIRVRVVPLVHCGPKAVDVVETIMQTGRYA